MMNTADLAVRGSVPIPGRDPATADAYAPPRMIDLGTLAELTRGGSVGGQSDGFGDAGGSGTIP